MIPTMPFIVCTNPDSTVSVIGLSPSVIVEHMRFGRATGTILYDLTVPAKYPWPPAVLPSDAMTFDAAKTAAIAYVRGRRVPAGITESVVCEYGDLYPPGSEPVLHGRFRSCWRRIPGGLPTIDMPLARARRMNEARAVRNAKLRKNDDDYSRALKQKNLTLQTQLENHAEKLRNVPQVEGPTVDALTTLDQLVAWQPTWPVDPAP